MIPAKSTLPGEEDRYTVQDILSSCPHISYVGDFRYEDVEYHYNVWNSLHKKSLTYRILKSSLQNRHVFELLSFPDLA